jgi:MoaA/NifB/PqqE/SkfB family radical SAM enzyme
MTVFEQKTKKFCGLIFYGTEYRIGERLQGLRCCQDTDTAKVQQEFLKGNQPTGCNWCWNAESTGSESFRQLSNRTLDHLLDKSIETLQQLAAEQKNETYSYKIETGNLCNATCVTCGSRYSSAWGALERKNGRVPFPQRRVLVDNTGMRFDQNTFQNDQFFSIDYKKAKFINFLGGETTLEKSNFEILQQLIDADNTDCHISFTTNGNFNLSNKQQLIISKFPNMQFNFSIDGIGKVYEYLRYPLSWEKCLDNLQYCKDNKIDISVSTVLSNLNALYFDHLVAWLNKNQLPYHVIFAVNYQLEQKHALFSSNTLSLRVKSLIRDRATSDFVKNALSKHQPDDDSRYQLFLQDIVEKDCWKGIGINDYLPEFAGIIQEDLNKYL